MVPVNELLGLMSSAEPWFREHSLSNVTQGQQDAILSGNAPGLSLLL